MEERKNVAVTILIPAFNEEQAIGETVRRVKELHPDFEVLVVDDGSSDNTMQAAMDAGANVWPHPYNIGNGAAIKTGLRVAKGEWIIMMDADGQHDPEDIARLLELREEFDMVVGARTRDSDTAVHRDMANSLYNWFATYITSKKIEDLTSGFRMVKADTAREFIYLLPNTFSYPSTLTLAYLRSGRTLKYIPIETKKRIGKSKIKLLRDGARFSYYYENSDLILTPSNIPASQYVSVSYRPSVLLLYVFFLWAFYQYVCIDAEQFNYHFHDRTCLRADNPA